MTQEATLRHRTRRGRLTLLLRAHARWLALVTVLLVVLAVANMALPLCLKLLVDEVFPSAAGPGRWKLLWAILPGLAILYVIRNILFFTTRMISVRIGEDICFSLRSRLFEQLQQKSLDFYRSNQVGRLSSRVMNDTHKLLLFIQDKLPTLALNGGESNLTLKHFSVGTMVQMPDLLVDEIHVVDAALARYFFRTEHYYPAATQRIEQAIESLDQALRRPELRAHVEGVELPPGR